MSEEGGRTTQIVDGAYVTSTSLALLPFCSLLLASKFPASNPLAHRAAASLARAAGDKAGYAFASLPIVTTGLGYGWLQICQAAADKVRGRPPAP